MRFRPEEHRFLPCFWVTESRWVRESSNNEDEVARKEERLLSASNTPPRIQKTSVNSKEPERKNTATAASVFEFRMEPEESAASFQGSINALMAAKLEAVKFTALFDAPAAAGEAASLKAKPPLIYLYFTT